MRLPDELFLLDANIQVLCWRSRATAGQFVDLSVRHSYVNRVVRMSGILALQRVSDKTEPNAGQVLFSSHL